MLKPVIAHVREQFLPISETFIYQWMKRAERTRAVAVYAERQNECTFPWDDLYPVSYPGLLSHRKVAVAFLRASRIRPYANSMEGIYLKAFRELRPDLVHAHFGAEGTKVLRACEELGIPLVVGFYGYDFGVLPGEERWRVGYSRLFRYASRVNVPSEFAAGYLRRLGCPADKIAVIHLGVDLERLPFEEKKSAHGRPVHFIGVGRLVEKKGTRHVLEALSLTRRKHPGISYTHIGGGHLERELKALAARLGVDDICDFRGGQPHSVVLQGLREADIFLLPSVTASNGDVEGLPVTLVEAQAIGLPVIATRHAGIPEGVVGGESGYLVPERDVQALAERMSYLIEHEESWAEMGRRGRALIEERFDARKECAKLESLYDSVLDHAKS
jgi:colanic acid/amylovoran biosynthesis glycosyltransferase